MEGKNIVRLKFRGNNPEKIVHHLYHNKNDISCNTNRDSRDYSCQEYILECFFHFLIFAPDIKQKTPSLLTKKLSLFNQSFKKGWRYFSTPLQTRDSFGKTVSFLYVDYLILFFSSTNTHFADQFCAGSLSISI